MNFTVWWRCIGLCLLYGLCRYTVQVYIRIESLYCVDTQIESLNCALLYGDVLD